MATTRTHHKLGKDVAVGDMIDCGNLPFMVTRFEPYTGPLTEIAGPGRIAYNQRDQGFAVYDNHHVRLLGAATDA